MDLDRDKLLWIYRRMRQIRAFENRLHEDFAAGLIPGFVHLYAGEEAIAVGVCAHLDDDDFIAANTEGLMVKSLDGAGSSYEPSNRSQNWLKIKKDYVDGLTDSFNNA